MNNRILIVEDDEASRFALANLLNREGYQLTLCTNGKDALVKARTECPDLILLDVMMPGMNGYEVCRHIRQDERLAELPIILVTTLDGQQARLQGLEAGADDFISKPYDRVELRARVRTILKLNRYRLLTVERQKFAYVVESANEGYLILNAEGKITYANRQAKLFLGEDAPLNQNFLSLAQIQYSCEPEAAWSTWLENLKDTCYLVRPETPHSGTFWLEVERHQLDTHNTQKELLIRLRDVNAKMRERQRAWSFERLVSHKLRTPLSVLSAFQLLKLHLELEKMRPEILTLLGVAEHGLEQLKQQIESIISYIDAPKWLLNQEHGFQLSQLEALMNEFRETTKLTIHLDLPESLRNTRLTLSHHAFRTILQELVENSRKFYPDKQSLPTLEIKVELTYQQRAARIRVADNGQHLAPNELLTVWRPYYQSEKEFTGETVGMGLGLPMIASLVWGVGGQYRLSNRTDAVGVVVELILPLADSETNVESF